MQTRLILVSICHKQWPRDTRYHGLKLGHDKLGQVT